MKALKQNYAILIFMVMVLAHFCRIEVLAFGLVAIIIICSMYNNTKIMKKLFPGNIWYISLLVLGILMGICNYFWGDYSIKNIVKDIVYCSMPLLYWLAGENIVGVKKNINKEDIYRVLFVIGTGFAVYDLCHSILIILKNGIGDGSLYGLRALIGTGDSLAVITLFIGIYFLNEIKIKKWIKNISICILVADIFIHFSRTNLMLMAIFVVYLGIVKRPKKLVKYFGISVICIILISLIFPSMVGNFVNKILSSFTEVSFGTNSWDFVAINNNWRGYEAYCEIEQFKADSVIEKLFGGGFGTQLDVNGYAYLVSSEDMLPFLHNGYFTILMKWGIWGEGVYILMLIYLYYGSKLEKGKERRCWKAIVIIIALETTIVHGLLFSSAVAILMFFLGIIYGINQPVRKRK